MNKPKISIVFTSYNHKEYLHQALDSLLAQTFKEFELIIIDDCSTDGSKEILKEYSSKDSRVKLILNEKNSGSYVLSTNQGASYASADLIIFAQCDDWAEKNQLEKLYKAITENKTDVVFSSSRMVDEKGVVLGSDFEGREKLFQKRHNTDSIITKSEAKDYLLRACIIPNLSAALIRKSLFKEIGGLSSQFVVLADWDFWLKASLKTDIYFIRESLNNFRQHSTTIRSAVRMKKQINEIFIMLRNHQEVTLSSSISTCHRIVYLWLQWAAIDLRQWMICFPSIFFTGLSYSFYFPIALCLESVKAISRKLVKKIIS